MARVTSALLRSALAVVVGVTLVSCTSMPQHPDRGAHATEVAFYGDSYTLGTGASDSSKRWSSIVCAEREWREFNPSTNGLGFINNRTHFGDGDEVAEVIADHPDIVFITMGLNDNFSYDFAAEAIHAQIDDDLHRIATALPSAHIIVVEPFWYTDERPASVDTIIGWVHEASEQIGADWVPGASHWIDGHPEWKAADGLHPNDEGYAHIAEQMDDALADLGLPALS
jgi:lysophospholipase L1-like esterase